MKKQVRWNFLLLGLLSIMFSNCIPSRETISTITNILPSINSTQTVVPSTVDIDALAIKTVTTTNVVDPSIPTEIHVETVAPSSLPIPTLAAETASERLANLILTNGNCSLPCFLGITPGVSTADEFDTILTPYSTILTILEGKYRRGIEFELGQKIVNNFLIDYQILQGQPIIEKIHLSTKAYQRIEYPYPDEEGNTYELVYEYGAEAYRQLMGNYTLQKILTEYGIPSRVLVYAEQYLYDGRPPLPSQQFGQLKLRLFYPEQGIIIMYEMPLSKVGSKGQGCPSHAFISLWLTPPDSEEIYAKLLSKSSAQGDSFELEKPIFEATNISLEEFYEIYRDSSETCIQAPLSIWKQP